MTEAELREQIHRILCDEMPDNIGGDADIIKVMQLIADYTTAKQLETAGRFIYAAGGKFEMSCHQMVTMPTKYAVDTWLDPTTDNQVYKFVDLTSQQTAAEGKAE